MKWLILLILILILFAFLINKYRRQIQMAIYVWRMFRKMRQAGKADEKQIETQDVSENGQLIRCAKCGTWTPQKNALNLRSGVFYCSSDCMEQAVKV